MTVVCRFITDVSALQLWRAAKRMTGVVSAIPQEPQTVLQVL